MPLNFTLVEQNPNDSTGGGGSLASPMHDADATGPYFVWPQQEFESGASPFAVVAASEVRAMYRTLVEYEGGDVEPLAGGETPHDTSTAPTPGRGGTVSDEFDLEVEGQPEAFVEALRRK